MSKTIVILDYKMGNLHSIYKKLAHKGFEIVISNDENLIRKADKLILPGVGHFGKAMANLKELNLISVLHREVVEKKKPILGICLGMQLMTKFSEEGECDGLAWIDAQVRHFKIKDRVSNKVPNTGWDGAFVQKDSSLFLGIPKESDFYFVHSYYVEAANQEDILTKSVHEIEFTSACEKENIYGVQFHPEKSHQVGDLLLNNFLAL